MNDIDWGWVLMEIGTWLIAIGLTFGVFLGLLWCLAKLVDIGERR